MYKIIKRKKSPKSKEGCRCTPRQGKRLRDVAFDLYGSANALKNYCAIKRLILLKP